MVSVLNDRKKVVLGSNHGEKWLSMHSKKLPMTGASYRTRLLR